VPSIPSGSGCCKERAGRDGQVIPLSWPGEHAQHEAPHVLLLFVCISYVNVCQTMLVL
jgi:hypothetical protein